MPSLLSRLSSLVPAFRPFATPAGAVRRRPTPDTDERFPVRSAAALDRVWFLPYADDTSTGDSPEIRSAMRLMLRDPYVKSGWLTQVLGVLSQPFQVHTPKGSHKGKDAQEQADFVRYCLEHAVDGMLGIGTAILTNLGSDGFTLSEKVWQIEARGKYANRLTLRALKPKDVDEHGRLVGDRFNNVTGVLNTVTGKTYPISDFVYTRYLHTFDEPLGMAAFRPSYGAYWSRDTVRKLRIIHKEKMLDGLLVGSYTDPADKPTLETALARARTSTWLSIPEGVRIEQLAKSQAAESDYKSFDESLREEILVGIALAHLHILQGGVSDARGNTKVHKAVADLGPWLLTYIVQNALNRQVIPDLIDYNYPFTSEYPTISLGGVENAEILEMLQVLDGAQRAGFKPSRNYYATELTIQEADPTDPTDHLAPPPPGGGMGGPGGPGGSGMGPEGGGNPFGGGGLGPPPAPAGGGGGAGAMPFAERQAFEPFAWEDWKQVEGGKWKSESGKRTLSDAVYQRLSKRAGSGGDTKPPATTPPTPSPAVHRMTRDQFEAELSRQDPDQFTTQTVVDWGRIRQQGKRAGGMVRGSMSDPPKGKKTYTDRTGKLDLTREQRTSVRLQDEASGGLDRYLRGRAMGLTHDQAFAVMIPDHEGGGHAAVARDALQSGEYPAAEKVGRGSPSLFADRGGDVLLFGWDDWEPKGNHMISPGGRVLRRETWERLKSARPEGGGPTTANGPAAVAPPRAIPADRHIQARLDRIRGNRAETLKEVEGDVRAAAVELGANPPAKDEVVRLVAANTPGLDPVVQAELGQKLADAAAAGSPEGVKSGWRKLAEWAASLPLKAATAAARGLLWLGKRLLHNTAAALMPPPAITELPGKLARTAPSVLKYVGVIALSAGLFAASIAVPVLLPVMWAAKLGIAAVTAPAGAAWLTWGMRRALKPVGREVMDRWAGHSEDMPKAGEELALAGRDGKRAAELMGRSQKQGREVLAKLTEQAVGRLLADGDPLGATVLFDDDELKQVAASLSATTAAADLLGRSRVRRLAHHHGRKAERFDEWTGPHTGERGGVYWLKAGAVDAAESRVYQDARPAAGQAAGQKPKDTATAGEVGKAAAKPDGVKESRRVAKAADVANRASDIRVSDDPVGGSSVDRNDLDAIEGMLDSQQQRKLARYLERQREDSIDEYDPDDDIDDDDRKEAAARKGWDDAGIRDKATEAVGEHVADEHTGEANGLIDEWYKHTNGFGAEAVADLSAALRQHDFDDLADRLDGLKDKAHDEIRDDLEDRREELRREKMEGYDTAADREEWLQEWHDENAEDFAVPEVDRWGKDSDGDYVYHFATSDGSEYKANVVDDATRFVGGVRVPEFMFSDSADSVKVTGNAGAKTALEVFGAVTPAAVAILTKNDYDAMQFSAAEPSRQKLYDRLVRTTAAAAPDYTAVAVTVSPKMKKYLVVKRDKLGEYMDAIKGLMAKNNLPADAIQQFADDLPEGVELLEPATDAEIAEWASLAAWGGAEPEPEPEPEPEAFSEGDGPDGFDVFADAPELQAPNLAADYFRGLVPDLGIDPQRYAPSLDRHAFTLSVAADQVLLDKVKRILLDQIEAGRRPFAVADIQDELDEAGITPRNSQYAEMVYRTNMNDAYMQGFSREMATPDMQQAFPAWQYLIVDDERTGDDHRPKGDRYYPNTATFAEVRGDRVFNCRCSASPIHKVEWDRLKRQGVGTEPGW